MLCLDVLGNLLELEVLYEVRIGCEWLGHNMGRKHWSLELGVDLNWYVIVLRWIL
jgi:hypothetical protein